MKPVILSSSQPMRLRAGLLAIMALLICRSVLHAEEPKKEKQPGSKAEDKKAVTGDASKQSEKEEEDLEEWRAGGDYSGWASLTLGGASVSGSPSAFRERHTIRDGIYGGVSEFYWEKFVGDSGVLKLNGRTVAGNEDYQFKLDYTDEQKGFLRAGMTRRRTWSDGIGGFNPTTGAWVPLGDRELALDRGSYWIEGGLTLPEWPVFTLRYEHQYRHGQQDSTIWGTTSAALGRRSIAASFQNINERRDIVRLDMRHTIGRTSLDVGGTFERYEADNSLNFTRDVGLPVQDFTTQRERTVSDMFSVHGVAETRLKENLSFSSGYSFTTLDADFTGSRIIGAGYDPVFDPTLARFPGFTGLTGGSELRQHVASFSLAWFPTKTISVVPSVRFDALGLDSGTLFNLTPLGASSLQSMAATQDFLDLSQRLEVRYTGWTNWVFYVRGDWDQSDGDLRERQIAVTSGALQFQRQTDFSRFTQKYTAGANWYPWRKLNMAAQYYHKRRENDFDHNIDTTSNIGGKRYPAFLTRQDFDTHDANMRVTWRPWTQFTSVSRYDFQVSTIDTGANGLAAIQSADMNSHVFSQSLTWSPLSRLYVQGVYSYVMDTTSTPADQPGGVVLEAENNYWDAGVSLGYALDKRTDLEGAYHYYEADNFVDNSAVGQPYGAGFREHRVTAAIIRRITPNMRLILRYGWFANDDITFGGNQDYRAHIVQTTLQCRF